MVCLRTFRRHWICSTFVFSLFLLFSVFGLSQNSYATSVSCSISFSSNNYYYFSSLSACDTSSLDSSSVWYYYGSFDYVRGSSNPYLVFSSVSSPGNSNFPYSNYATGGLSAAASGTSVPFITNSIPAYRFNLVYLNYDSGSSYSNFSLTISDSFGASCPECEVCQVCPEIPENPYDNKFDALTKAIYCCGAILIMLYFFFCIYKIIVKDGGSR